MVHFIWSNNKKKIYFLDENLQQSSLEKINPHLKLNHLFGVNQRNSVHTHLNHSYLSTASSHDSEENMMRMNNSCVYSSATKAAFPGSSAFQQKNINQISSNYANSSYNKFKSLHISSNQQQKKIEEQEEKDDEDLFLNISKFYINNVEEDPNEALKVVNQKLVEDKKKIIEQKQQLSKKNPVFEFSSRNNLDFPRKKKNFPQGDSEKYDIDLDNVFFFDNLNKNFF